MRSVPPAGVETASIVTPRSSAAASAGYPYTTACWPSRMILPRPMWLMDMEVVEEGAQRRTEVTRRAREVGDRARTGEQADRADRLRDAVDHRAHAIGAAGALGAQHRCRHPAGARTERDGACDVVAGAQPARGDRRQARCGAG